MTLDDIDRLVRQANPVPDPTIFETIDASVLAFERQGRTEMQTHERIEVGRPRDEKPRRGPLVAFAAAAVVVVAIGALILARPGDESPVSNTEPVTPTTEATVSTTAPDVVVPSPVDIATGYVNAYAAFDVEGIASFLAPEELASEFDGIEGLATSLEWWKATGFEVLPGPCTDESRAPSDLAVRCPYDFQGLRSGELGLGPYSGNWYDFTIEDGKIVRIGGNFDTGQNGFSAEVWEPFAAWIVEAHPEDVAVMYTSASQSDYQDTEESNQLWEQRTKEYVAIARAEGYLDAFAGYDAEAAATYLSADELTSEYGGIEGLRLHIGWNQATGFKVAVDSCTQQASSSSGTSIRCTYDFSGLRSDERGLGPYSGSWFELTVLDGNIVRVSDRIEFVENGFSGQVWEPFAIWVAEAYPEDSAQMYVDQAQTDYALTEESIRLWEQHTIEFVDVAG